MSDNTRDSASTDQPHESNRVRNALLWIGAVSAVSVVAAFVVVRATVGRNPSDPTSDRIQALIDEANTLLKSLDAQGHG